MTCVLKFNVCDRLLLPLKSQHAPLACKKVHALRASFSLISQTQSEIYHGVILF